MKQGGQGDGSLAPSSPCQLVVAVIGFVGYCAIWQTLKPSPRPLMERKVIMSKADTNFYQQWEQGIGHYYIRHLLGPFCLLLGMVLYIAKKEFSIVFMIIATIVAASFHENGSFKPFLWNSDM